MTKCFLFMILSACFVLLILPTFAAADSGDRVCIYKHDNFHGHEQCYRLGSLRVVPDYAFYDRDRLNDREHYPYGDTYIYRSKPTPAVVDEGVCVYEMPGFEGRFQCWSANTDISDLSFADWKNKISSVRVFGHVRLVGYKDTEFRGDRIIIDHDVTDLSTLPMARAGNWNHEIRSLEVQLE